MCCNEVSIDIEPLRTFSPPPCTYFDVFDSLTDIMATPRHELTAKVLT